MIRLNFLQLKQLIGELIPLSLKFESLIEKFCQAIWFPLKYTKRDQKLKLLISLIHSQTRGGTHTAESSKKRAYQRVSYYISAIPIVYNILFILIPLQRLCATPLISCKLTAATARYRVSSDTPENRVFHIFLVSSSPLPRAQSKIEIPSRARGVRESVYRDGRVNSNTTPRVDKEKRQFQ